MTNQQRCRDIARALDAADLSVLTADEQFIRAHRSTIWDLRKAQQAKRTRVVVTVDDSDDDSPTVAEPAPAPDDDDEPARADDDSADDDDEPDDKPRGDDSDA